jgi:hypothetical protein
MIYHECNALTRKIMKLNKSFCGGSRGTYSAVLRNTHRDDTSLVLRNTHRDDTSFEASYAVLALQMLPHAVGFFLKRAPGRRRQKKTNFRGEK